MFDAWVLGMIVTLIGYRGSGKSSVARPLAERLDWACVDADEEIERQAGCSIRDIFEADGEPAFRDWERKVIAQLLAGDRLVLAAGGGAVLNDQTRAELRAAGPVVWLRASPAQLEQRIVSDETTAERRPNLTVAGGQSEIVELLSQREPLYLECASITIETDSRSLNAIVEAVHSAVLAEISGGTRR